MESIFDTLSDEIVLSIFHWVPIKHIPNLCLTSIRFNDLANDNLAWKQRFIATYGYDEATNWKNAYQNYGKVIAFGSNHWGQMGNINTKKTLSHVPLKMRTKAVACGDVNTLIIDLNNDVLAFGHNEYGQLGMGDYNNRNTPQRIGCKAKAVACSGRHTMLIDLNDDIWAFGDNGNGQLGLGNIEAIIPKRIKNFKAKSISCGSQYTMMIDINNNVWAGLMVLAN